MRYIFLSIVLFMLLSCNKGSSDAARSAASTGAGGSTARFTIVGNYLYTVDKETLKVFDVSAAAAPVFLRSVPVGFDIETIYPFKDKLFIGSTSVVHIFSLSDPANPQKLSQAVSPEVIRRCDPVVAKDTVAYATLRANGSCGGAQSILATFDIRNVTSPVQKASFSLPEPYGLGYKDSTLYVCDRHAGVMVFNISNGFQPTHVKNVGSANDRYLDVIPYNNLLVCWIDKGMALYDISNQRDPVFIKTIN